MADLAGEGVAVLLEVTDAFDVAVAGLVDVDELADVQKFEDPAEGGDGLAERGGGSWTPLTVRLLLKLQSDYADWRMPIRVRKVTI